MPYRATDLRGPGDSAPLSKSALAGRLPLSPVSVNWHLWPFCNYKCRFCFATFSGNPETLRLEDTIRIPALLRDAGTEKLTFVGGEPTLHPQLPRLLRASKATGLTTMVVTNGYLLANGYLDRIQDHVDWIALSVDSASNEVEEALGRGHGDHVDRTLVAADLVKEAGIRLKVNTVVTALTWQEDMHPLILRLGPERWKVFQVLRIFGENDGVGPEMWITTDQFRSFLARHADLNPIGEDNGAMTGSYLMLDPLGRFFQNSAGSYEYSASILEVGVLHALAEVGWDAEKFVRRGGRYGWALPNKAHGDGGAGRSSGTGTAKQGGGGNGL